MSRIDRLITPESTKPCADIAVDEDEVAALAYRLWLDRGRPDGSPEEDWYLAERKLRRLRPPLVQQEERMSVQDRRECNERGADAANEAPLPEKVLEAEQRSSFSTQFPGRPDAFVQHARADANAFAPRGADA
jgi:hypothetical protein